MTTMHYTKTSVALPGTHTRPFADILKANLGSCQWQRLNPHIRARFIPTALDKALQFQGVMQHVYCSPAGAVLAWIMKPFAVLPGVNRQHTRFDFSISNAGDNVYKRRRYFFEAPPADREVARTPTPFTFISRFSDEPRLHEEFRGGLGMYLVLAEENGQLLFRDDGYFFRIGKFRLPLPKFFSVGSFELLHRNIGRHRFQVIIRIVHPLLGLLFYQRGIFDKTTSVAAY